MAAVALLRFRDALNTGANGNAFVSAVAQDVIIENSVNTDVLSWRIWLVYAPPGSAREIKSGIDPFTLLASNSSSTTPSATLTNLEAGFYGCYRIMLEVFDAPNFGGNLNVDIRNIAVLTTNRKIIIPPYQLVPAQLPVTGSNLPGEKPNELNFDGQPYGWAGDESALHRGLNKLLLELDTSSLDIVGITAGDTTPGYLQAKLTEGNRVALSVVNPGGNETLRVDAIDELPEPAATNIGDALTVVPSPSQYLLAPVTDGTSFWVPASGLQSSLSRGYVRGPASGALITEYGSYTENPAELSLVYEPVVGQMVLLEADQSVNPGSSTWIVPISIATPAVRGTAVAVEAGGVRLIAGGGWLWMQRFGGMVRIDPSNFATRTTFATDASNNLYGHMVFDGDLARYGDGYGRLFIAQTTSSSGLFAFRRFHPDTLVEEGLVFVPPGLGIAQIAELSLNGDDGRLWSAWSDFATGKRFVGSFDCSPLGTNLKTAEVQTLVSFTNPWHSTVYDKPNATAVHLGFDPTGTHVVLVHLTESVPSVTVVDNIALTDIRPSVAGSASTATRIASFGGYVWFSAQIIATSEFIVVRYNIATKTATYIHRMLASEWIPDSNLVAATNQDTTPSYLGNKITSSSAVEATVDPPFTPGNQVIRFGGPSYGTSHQMWFFRDGDIADNDPGATNFKPNNADIGAATFLYVSKTSYNEGAAATNTVGSRVLSKIHPLDKLVIRTANAIAGYTRPRTVVYTVSGAVIDAVNYVKIPVTVDEQDILAQAPQNGDYFIFTVYPNKDLLDTSWKFDTATVDADPTSGFFRMNTSSPGTTTSLFVSNTSWSVASAAILGALRTSGLIIVDGVNETLGARLHVVLQVFGLITNTGTYSKIPVQVLEWNSVSPSAGDYCSFQFIAAEAKEPITGDTVTSVGTINNYALNRLATEVRFNLNTGNLVLTGMVYNGGPRKVRLINLNSAYSVVLTSGDARSSVGNQFAFSSRNSSPLTIPPLSSVETYYDSLQGFWIVDRLNPYMFSPTPDLASPTQNNYAPVTGTLEIASFLRLHCAGNTDLTGIVPGLITVGGGLTSGLAVPTKKLFNVGAGTITLKHQNVGSTDVNRFIIPGGVDLPLATDDVVDITYDPVTLRWRVG